MWILQEIGTPYAYALAMNTIILRVTLAVVAAAALVSACTVAACYSFGFFALPIVLIGSFLWYEFRTGRAPS